VSQRRQAISFAAGLYRQRIGTAVAGHLQRDPMALLQLRPGREDPYAIYARMRRAGALGRTRRGNWVITGHRLCNQVLRDRRFGVRPAGSSHLDSSTDGLDVSFLEMNPPDHTRLRRLVQPAFSPKGIAAYRPRIERKVAQLLDDAPTAGAFDLVPALTNPLPIAVIIDLLGIPDADAENFARHGTVIGGALDGIRSLSHAARMRAAGAELMTVFGRLFVLRRKEPADDLVSTLVAAKRDRIRPGELYPLCVLLLVSGFETTVNLIGNTVNALLDHPAQWAAVCADPATMAGKAVEETLRFDPPIQRTRRFALEPVELAGQLIDKDQLVLPLIGAANRDPEVYPDPDRFDIHRESTADHLAFGSGIHYCIGQPLALLEATVAVRVLAERLPQLRRAGPTRRRNSNIIRGPLHLPVRADPLRR
jgi:P450-derived glycosyltransferase activator